MTEHETHSPHSLWRYAPFVALGIVAAWMIHYGTAVAPWAYSDGVGYLVSARNLVEGPGLGLVKPSGQFEPLVTHPPLYPLLLAAGKLFGSDVITAARWVGVLSFGLLIGLSGGLTLQITQRLRTAIGASLLLLACPPIVLMFLAAMAEPVFLLTGILSLLILARGVQLESRRLLTLSAALAGLSALSRYPGLVFALTGALVLLLSPGGVRQRLKASALYAGIGAAPLAGFLAVSRWLRAAGAPRWPAAPGLDLAELTSFARQTAEVVWTWKPLPTAAVLESLAPGWGPASTWLGAALALLIGASLLGYLWLQRARIRVPAWRWEGPVVIVCAVFTLLYLGFLLAAFLFTSPTPDVDFRTVLPLLPALIIAFVTWLSSLPPSPEQESKPSKALYGLLIAAIALGYLPPTAELLIGHHRTGAGYTAKAWQASTLLQVVEGLPQEFPLISNVPEAILLTSNRFPYDLNPWLKSSSAPCLGNGSSSVDEIFRDRNGIVILASTGLPEAEDASASAAIASPVAFFCQPQIIYEGTDGLIIVHTNSKAPPVE